MSPVQEVPRPTGSSAVRHDEIPPRTPTPGTGGAGPEFDEPLTVTDAGIMGFAKNEPLVMADAAVMGFAKNEPLLLPDDYAMTDLFAYDDPLTLDDAFAMTAADLIVGRSGTPDTDQISDAWVDQAAPTVNHGNESLQSKQPSTVPGSDDKFAYIQVDLTRVTGVTAGAAGGTLAIIASIPGILVTSLATFFAVSTSPFITESTLTWNNQPAPSWTALNVLSIAVGAAATYTVTFTQAQLATMIGKWVVFGFGSNNAVAVPVTVTILSRDNATASNRPKFTAAYKVP